MITKNQKRMMEHALGLNYEKAPFRNKYCTYSVDSEWEELKELGLAGCHITISGKTTYYFYYVTEKGQEQLGLKCECSELGCQNKFYKRGAPFTQNGTKPKYCRKHYNMYK